MLRAEPPIVCTVPRGFLTVFTASWLLPVQRPKGIVRLLEPQRSFRFLNFQSCSLMGVVLQVGWRMAALKSLTPPNIHAHAHMRDRERESAACLLFLRQGLRWPRLVSNLLCSPGLSLTSDPSSFPALQCWDHSSTPACLACTVLRIEPRALCTLGRFFVKLVSRLLFLIVFTKYFSLNRELHF